MINVIYKIQSTINGKFYIGSAKIFNYRKNQHIHHLRKNSHSNKRIQNHVNKYGINDLMWIIIESECDELIKREQHYIDTLNPFFNIHKTAQSPLGLKRTPEQIQRMLDGKKIKSGWKLSAETCKAIGDRHRGKTISEEQRDKLRAANKNRIVSPETRAKISIANKGKKHSAESIIKMSAAAMGNQKWKFINYKSIERSEKLRAANSIKIIQSFNGQLIKEWESARLAGKTLNLNSGNISSCCAGKRKTVGGFSWQKK